MRAYRKCLVLIWFCFLLTVDLSFSQSPKESVDTIYFSEIYDTLNYVYTNPLKFIGSEDMNEGFLKFYDELKGLIIGTYLDDLKILDIDENKYQLSNINKPIFFHVTASWCAPCQSEKPALKDLVEKYKEQIVFISIFWDGIKGVQKMRTDYHRDMILIPSSVKQKGPNEAIVPGFRHSLGFPFTFFIDENKKIKDVTLGGSTVGTFPGKDGQSITYTEEDVYKNVTKAFENGISLLLGR